MFSRHCEPPGRANARPMTGSAKQSILPLAAAWIASSLALFAMTRRGVASRAHRLDVVAIRVDQERRVIGRAVIRAWTGAAVVAAAGFEALGMKLLDRRMIPGAERD